MGTQYRKIWQGPADAANCHPLTVEGISTAAVRPGSLCVKSGANLDESALAATVFSQDALVALERGAHYGADITTVWPTGDTVVSAKVRSGEFVLVLVAATNNITSEEVAMSSNGDGTLKIAATDGTEKILFRSREIVNVTGSPALVAMTKEV